MTIMKEIRPRHSNFQKRPAVRKPAGGGANRQGLASLFPARVLLWKITEADREEREAIRDKLLNSYHLPRQFFLAELGSPSVAVRVEALRFLERSLPLEEVNTVMPLLQDYNVDVREQARRTVAGIVQRYAQQPLEKGLAANDDKSLRQLLESFSSVLAAPDLGAGSVMLDVLLAVGASRPREFWSFFEQCPDQVRQNLCAMFLARRGEATRRTLLLGTVYAPAAVREKVDFLLRRSLAYETARGDIDLFFSLEEEMQEKVFRGLDKLGVLSAYLEKPTWIRSSHRPLLLKMIPQVGGDRYQAALQRALTTPDPGTVLAALQVAVDEAVPGLNDSVLPHLKSTDDVAVSLALSYLGRFGECELIQTLLPLLESDSPEVSQAANKAIYSITQRHLFENFDSLTAERRRMLSRTLQKLDAGFGETLVQRILDAAAEDRTRLVQVLSALGKISPESQERIKALFEDSNPRVRATAARVLHLLEKPEERFSVSLRLLFDEDARVRANAVEEVEMKRREILSRVVELAEEGNPRERANAVKRLWLIEYAEARNLFERFVGEPGPSSRLAAAWLYGELAPEGTVRALRKYLEDPLPQIRVRAIHSLGKAAADGDIRSLTFLLDDSDNSVRHAAKSVIYERLHLEYQVA
jgi:HEAT repeat protein